jgi:hypothetical protein
MMPLIGALMVLRASCVIRGDLYGSGGGHFKQRWGIGHRAFDVIYLLISDYIYFFGELALFGKLVCSLEYVGR